MTSKLILIAILQAKPGQEHRLRTELEAAIEPTLADPGCLAFRPYLDPNDPGAFVIVEEWTDKDALVSHFKTAQFNEVAGILEEILAEPPTRLVTTADVGLEFKPGGVVEDPGQFALDEAPLSVGSVVSDVPAFLEGAALDEGGVAEDRADCPRRGP